VSNSAVFATTAWVALGAIWVGAMLTDALVDWPAERGRSLGEAATAALARWQRPAPRNSP
jgi:hypothetical protein